MTLFTKRRQVFKKYEFLDELSRAGYDSRMVVKMWWYWEYKRVQRFTMEATMKLLLAFLFLICMTTTAKAMVGSGDLVLSGSYLDDVPNTQVAPQASLVMAQALSGDWALSEVVSAGHINQLDDSNGYYGRLGADLWYAGLAKDLKLGVGGAVESNKQIYKSYGDYAHVSLSYKLW